MAGTGVSSEVASSDPFSIAVRPPVLGAPSYSAPDLVVPATNPGGTLCTLYYVVLPAAVSIPAANDIKAAGTFSGNVRIAPRRTINVSVRGLSSGSHRFHAIFVAGTGVSSEVASSDPFSIAVRPPVLGAPSYSAPDLVVPATNPGGAPCTLYYVVLPAAVSIPAANDIKTAGTFSGNVRIAPRRTINVSVRGLSSGSHRFHAFFEDEAGAPSSVRSSSDFTISSAAILHAPSLGAPSTTAQEATIPVTNVGGTACTLYYVVLTSDRPVPSTSSIQSATAFIGSVSVASGATVDVVVQGLPSAAAHRFHAFFETADGRPSSVSSSDPFTILAAPRFGTVVPMADSAATVIQSTNDSILCLYWMVRPAAAEAPTKDAIETATALSGNVRVEAEGSQRISVRDLVPGTAYRFHAFFEAEVDGSSSAVSSGASFTTPSLDPALGFATPSVSILPNPVADVLTIQSSASGTALLYDLSGVLLDSRAITPGISKFPFIDHSTGLYLVRFVFADGEIIRRVVRR